MMVFWDRELAEQSEALDVVEPVIGHDAYAVALSNLMEMWLRKAVRLMRADCEGEC